MEHERPKCTRQRAQPTSGSAVLGVHAQFPRTENTGLDRVPQKICALLSMKVMNPNNFKMHWWLHQRERRSVSVGFRCCLMTFLAFGLVEGRNPINLIHSKRVSSISCRVLVLSQRSEIIPI
jgi:hypothetical protein